MVQVNRGCGVRRGPSARSEPLRPRDVLGHELPVVSAVAPNTISSSVQRWLEGGQPLFPTFPGYANLERVNVRAYETAVVFLHYEPRRELRRRRQSRPIRRLRSYSPVSAERVAGDRLGVQRAQPAAAASDPDGAVRCVDRHQRTVHGELLLHLYARTAVSPAKLAPRAEVGEVDAEDPPPRVPL